jgi:hypothetical protein
MVGLESSRNHPTRSASSVACGVDIISPAGRAFGGSPEDYAERQIFRNPGTLKRPFVQVWSGGGAASRCYLRQP